MVKSAIDKYGIILSKNSYEKYLTDIIPNSHVKLSLSYGKLHLTVTSKAVPQFDKLNHITCENIEEHSQLIFKHYGYNIPSDVIMTSPLYWLDMKTDLENTTGYSNKDVISVLRERSYKNSTKYETPSFDKDKGFENSILVRPTSKTVKDSICVYEKIQEIISNRHRYPDYYQNFSEDFLFENRNILRFERRLQSSKDIKKAFHLENLEYVTLSDIYDSNVDVVADKVRKLFI